MLALVAVPTLALAAWAFGRNSRARSASESEVLGWARHRGHFVRRAAHGVEVVGALGTRRFTVALHPGPPLVLLLAVDCDVESQEPPDGVRVQDGALVSRITSPAPAHLADLDGLIVDLVALAEEVERTHPPSLPELG